MDARFHYHIHEGPQVVPILGQINLVYEDTL